MTDHQEALPPELIRAYRETHYRVAGATPFILRVDRFSAALKRLLQQTSTGSATYLTACNPHGRLLDAPQNAVLQQRLEARLWQSGLRFLPGIGQHPVGDWPGEPSFLILGLSLDESRAWSCELQQHAFVWADALATPRLVFTTGMSAPG